MGYFEYDERTLHAIDYRHFLLDSPSPYHAADLVAQRLIDAGFIRQNERDPWDASPGGHVMVRNGAVIAWVVPHTINEGAAFRIVGAHTDSPAFTIKPSLSSSTPDGWALIDVEIYGGMIWNSWLDRELAIAGRLIMADGSEVLVRTGALARIPQLAIHLDRSVNSEGLHLNPQKHLHPVWTLDNPEADLLLEIARYAGVHADDIVSHDLLLIPQQGPETFGATGEFLAAAQQDNLSSVHAGLTALEHLIAKGTPPSGDILIFACFNHEEIGSETRSGAAGPLLHSVLERTAAALGHDLDGCARMFAASSCISVDAAHSVHPNYPEHHDPQTRPVMGRGPVLKLNANQHYASDAESIAVWTRACRAAGIPHQTFVSNNAMPCGTTIGPITATRLGILTVDVGIGLLSMHSAREMSHLDDLLALRKVLEAYWAGA